MKRTEIILIGPPAAGKSTLGKLLSDRLGLTQVSLDLLKKRYYGEVGYDDTLAEEIRRTQGFPALVQYRKQYDAHAVERVLAEHAACVIDLGAGHSVYEDEREFQRVQRALAPYANVVLVLPSPDAEESIAVLKERLAPVVPVAAMAEVIENLVKHPSNQRLATIVVYTLGKTPEETCEEILSLIVV